ncbi:MAG: CCA tRNA nucleotidyltransferase [Candidatus Izimaplasma sp.]|nr:CCA tRNA nucleotidyltransferase [Candidatus Izimaplasma bacterium]
MTKNLENAKKILKKLKSNGYEAYIVGGFVRDHLIGRTSKDIDITTNATPDEVIEVFNNVKETGKKYGSVTVLKNNFKYEVTTFRTEQEYSDRRRPDEIEFSNNIKEDLTRRDFTMNALLMTENEEIIDILDGQKDVENKLIRTINDPDKRFKEDALRILRAFRFVATLGFDIEAETLQALGANRLLIKDIAIERTMIELSKIFKGKYRTKAIKYLLETNVSEALFGIEEGLKTLSKKEQSLSPILAFTICFIKGEYQDVWKFSNRQKRLIKKLYSLHEVTKEDSFNKYIVFSNKLDLCLLANKINVFLGYDDQEKEIKKQYEELPVKEVCDLKFKGQDIIELTPLRKKSIIGLVIDDLLYNVIMGILPNEYEPLKEFSLKKIKELQNETRDKK